MTRLTDNTHPSHDWHPDDDVIACDLCGCRTYNDEAKQPCPNRHSLVSELQADVDAGKLSERDALGILGYEGDG